MPEPLHWLAARYGGTVRGPVERSYGHKSIYFWHTGASNAEAFLRRIQPYAIVKKAQIGVALRLRATIGPKGRSISAEVMALRDGLKAELSMLNQRGQQELS